MHSSRYRQRHSQTNATRTVLDAGQALPVRVSLVVGDYLEEEFGFEVSHWGPRPGQVSCFFGLFE